MIHAVYLVLVVFFIRCNDGLVVQTKNGALRGTINSTIWNSIEYSSFRGIPYAEPPLGELRFQPPTPARPWTGIRDATLDNPGCIQFNFLEDRYLGDEDCLYLNVYTPITNFTEPISLKPVIFWIHGGSYIYGSGATYLYGPDYLIEQDVVMVSLNYRLGILGFLTLNHPKALGNQGLKDQYQALKWVNENIASFGGDPNQVTILGQSAGAASVNFHMLSSRSRGLFKQAIAMSGSAFCLWAFHTNEEAIEISHQVGTWLGSYTNDDEKLLELLYTLPASKLVEITKIMYMTNPFPFRPTAEDVRLDHNDTAYLTDCPTGYYQRDDYPKYPVMMGFVPDEFGLEIYAINYLTNSNKTAGIIKNIFSSLLPPLNYIATDLLHTTIQILSTYVFIGPIDLTQKLLVRHNGDTPVYYYRNSYQSQDMYHSEVLYIPYTGTTHFDDLPLIFNMNGVPVVKDPQNPIHQFQSQMTTLFANFVKYGDPTPNNNSPINVKWLPSGLEGLQMELNTTFSMHPPAISSAMLKYEDSILPSLLTNPKCLSNIYLEYPVLTTLLRDVL
ncbi:unnamed protein product [Xylocopa violacea]|uniref:Carboxylic ester hydrolase n=1 Tax=Xylocopa violacea TaxID=135666 RepID=A0ABP1N3H7_XYLVO